MRGEIIKKKVLLLHASPHHFLQGVLRVSIDAPYAPEKTRPNFAETIAKALNLKMRTDGENLLTYATVM